MSSMVLSETNQERETFKITVINYECEQDNHIQNLSLKGGIKADLP